MAVGCYVEVEFEDAGPAIATRVYKLRDDYADDGTDWDTAVTDAAALITQLDLATMDHIKSHTLKFKVVDSGAAANVAANNNVEAFTRCVGDVFGNKLSFSVPAWDDVTFDKAPNGLLSAAYQAIANQIALLTRDPATSQEWTGEWSQSRGMKRGQRLVK